MSGCTDGTDGIDGINGVDGVNGTNGIAGIDGTNGSEGASGISGTNGTDGIDGEDLTISVGTKASKIQFDPIETPLGDAQNAIQSSEMVTFGDETQEIAFTKLLATGDIDNSEIFGQVKDYTDTPIALTDGTPYLCNGTNSSLGGVGSGLDYSSILQKNNELYLVSQFECGIGAMYMAKLEQNTQTGALSVKSDSLTFISQKAEFGGFVHCAGQRTPWESHLGSEEYEPDARAFEAYENNTSLVPKDYGNYNLLNGTLKYWGSDLSKVSPYYYGWTPEVKIDATGAAQYAKHYAMGRMAHELAYVMPDRKTVYMSDDGTNVGLFMFVADKAEDLSEGTLYAAKWNQISDVNGGKAELSWIKLGSANNAEIRAMVDGDNDVETPDGLKFSDIFDTDVAPSAGTCNDGFTSINTSAGHECLKVVSGQEKAAAFLEPRRYAAMLGATTEFNKEEGITFSKDHNRLFVAMSVVDKGMLDNGSNDTGGHNDIRVPKNACGTVYALDVSTEAQTDTNGTDIKSAYVVNNMYGIIGGAPTTYTAESPYFNPKNTCDVNNISEPDNVTYMDGSNLLFIGEDTGRHLNNMIWALDITNGSLSRVFATPKGAETTSPFWYENVNGWAYMTAVTQHPSTTSEELGQSSIGVMGAIKNVETLKAKKLIKLGSYNTHTEAGSEISAYDATQKKLFITNGATNKVDVVDMKDVQAPKVLTSIDLSSYGTSVQSVAVKNGKLAIAVGSADKVTTKGRVVVLNTSDNYKEIYNVEVGYLPDMVTFNQDGSKIVVANEGEPIGATTGVYITDASKKVTTNGAGDYVDVAGSVGVITVVDGSYADINFSTVTPDPASDTTPVRLGGTPSNDQTLDIEPEYITVKGNYAYVTLQENNAIAKVDLIHNTLTFVRSLGSKDYESENKIDIQEDGLIRLNNYKGLKALYMPDSISSYTFGGSTYLVTANEGDGREYPVAKVSDTLKKGKVWTDDEKISELTLDGSIANDYLYDNDLKVMIDMGETAPDSKVYEKLYTFGGRSFSIWDANGKLIWDSGDSISKKVASYEPRLFNQDEGDIDGRSGNKGAEPEALTIGTIDGKTYAFVGLERQSAIVIYDITNPYDAQFVNYVVTHEQNDVSPEGMVFIPASSSPNGKNLLVVSYEVSGSTVVYEIK
ncbi:MAG: hypothetical protein B7X69_06525 [Sulfurovum sp. 39-42-12]|nr:MAG: hypothetical protein B7Y63_02460 [Sulfurovum sp. 35-42-20]OYZ25107.1 MAG: hypothetical protein B7Y23_07050 [Sulfurovum sp. 16-42-52]OYZ48949.1 MAG: hypothetical protein B7Y13_06260 [Sulfurovum sp. 24-42-9]OZA45087.1 MAG: hypothetical protein B7X80_06190 [Sulfurovum sp. 17-42-90]OZA59834.1 MAG: hypothetical protein B7X69_06525 [Sulfurovum sp. 39-42-12]